MDSAKLYDIFLPFVGLQNTKLEYRKITSPIPHSKVMSL